MKSKACSSEERDGLLHGALATKVMKFVIFISKSPSRIAKKDSTTNATLLVPNTQYDSSEVDQNEEIVAPEKEKSSTNHHQKTM